MRYSFCFFADLYNSAVGRRNLAMPPTEEDLAWIRSTFHPIPRSSLPDDCVEYSLYVISSRASKSSDFEVRERLRDVQKYATDLQRKWLKGYIWQRQGFSLELVKEDGEVCCFTDCWAAKNGLTSVNRRQPVARKN